MFYKSLLSLTLCVVTQLSATAFGRDPERIDLRFTPKSEAPTWSARKATLTSTSAFSTSTTDGDSFSIGAVDPATGHITYSLRNDAIEYDLCGTGPGELHLGSAVISAGVCITVPADRMQSILETTTSRIDGLAANGEFILHVNAYY